MFRSFDFNLTASTLTAPPYFVLKFSLDGKLPNYRLDVSFYI